MTDRLAAALSGLINSGAITAEQADAVRHAYAAQPEPAAPEAERSPWTGRLLEAAIYVGVAFVVVAVGLIIHTNWRLLSHPVRIGLTSTLTLAALIAGIIVARLARTRENEVTKRTASFLMTAAALLAAWTTYVILRAFSTESSPWGIVIVVGTALVFMIVAHLVAPTLLTELGLYGTSMMLLISVLDAVLPQPQLNDDFQNRFSVMGFSIIGAASLWAWGLSRFMEYRKAIAMIALISAIGASAMLDGPGGLHGEIAAGVLAVAALVTYLLTSELQWLVGAVLATTVLVFRIAGDALDQAVALLIAGLVLLAGAAVVYARRNKNVPGVGENPNRR